MDWIERVIREFLRRLKLRILKWFYGKTLIYHIRWDAVGSQVIEVDLNDWGKLVEGASRGPNENPSPPTPIPYGIKLEINRQFTSMAPIASVGLFIPEPGKSPLILRSDRTYLLEGRFLNPLGDVGNGDTWAVTVQARTGTSDSDTPSDIRLVASTQVKSDVTTKLNLNLPPGKMDDPNLRNHDPVDAEIPNVGFHRLRDASAPFKLALEVRFSELWAKAIFQHGQDQYERRAEIVEQSPLHQAIGEISVAGVGLALTGSAENATVACIEFKIYEYSN